MISKKKQVVNVGDFHPISFGNVVYKLFSKVIANCLKLVLPYAIFPSQSTFMSGRQLMDNFFIAYELARYLRRIHKRKQGFTFVKLDMNKTYD